MNEIYVTLCGNVTHEPETYPLGDGSRVAVIKVATSSRYVDRQTRQWRNGPTGFYRVRCYRRLADNVAQSLRKGHPVIVHGRLRTRETERDGVRRPVVEIEATSVGHDLKWGIATFQRPAEAIATCQRPAEGWAEGEQTAA